MKMSPKASMGFAIATIIAGIFSVISGTGDFIKAKAEDEDSQDVEE